MEFLTAIHHLYAKEPVEICYGHVPVLHLPAGVADGVHTASAEARGGPLGRGQLLPPGGGHLPELVEEQVLQTLTLQHCGTERKGQAE